MTSVSPPPAKSRHDTIYTVLLGVLAFFYLIADLEMWLLQGNAQAQDRVALRIVFAVIACYLLAMVAVLIIRIGLPAIRKWPTFALNIILAPYLPFGTALAIYGFWKVDKLAPAPTI